MGHNTHEMPSSAGLSRLRIAALSAAAWLLVASAAQAQNAPIPGAGTTAASVPPAANRGPGEGNTFNFVDSLIPGFQFDAGVNVSETYASNGGGFSQNSKPDYISLFALNLGMHEHSRSVSLDASYLGSVNYFANNTQPTQFNNNLNAVADVIAIPDYLTFIGKAFAEPVVMSNLGVVNANGGYSAGGYRNGYGYSVGPDITFRLEDFATSDTMLTYGAAYFTTPGGAKNFSAIPGVSGPEDTVMRSATEKLSSGTDFSRLTWSLVGVFSETERPQGLLSEKAGVGTLRYAISSEFSLLGTGGYDAISNTTSLNRNISGPVAMGGVAITFADVFDLEIQAGQKYNSPSFLGSLRYNITPTAMITGSATDSIQTPESALLDSLTNLTATPSGTLTSSSNVYSNGTASSLGSFSAQPSGSLSYNQVIARYQRVNLNFTEDFERDHYNAGVFGTRETQLSGVFVGPQVIDSWGAQASYSRDISRLMNGTLGATYVRYNELGGHASLISVNAQLSYSLSQDTHAYLRADYIDRISSSSLQALSPFTGSLDDTRVTIGLSHQL